MPKALVVVDVAVGAETKNSSFAAALAALQNAILASTSPVDSGDSSTTQEPPQWQVEVVATDELQSRSKQPDLAADDIVCSLTLRVPDVVSSPTRECYQACRALLALRQQVEAWGVLTGSGELWLPIVFTTRGPLYAEVIGRQPWVQTSLWQAKIEPFRQPVHLTDAMRQEVYQLGFRLLKHIKAMPAVYLLQFGLLEDQICFDRLWPFPALPAIASLQRQTPDLFACHWACLVDAPLKEITIMPTQAMAGIGQ